MFEHPVSDRRNVPESKPTPWLGVGVAIVIVAVVIYVVKHSQQNELHPSSPDSFTLQK